MNDHKDSNKTDLLDAALAAYRQVDPRPGLEARILGKLEERLRRRRFLFRLLLTATAGATGLGLVLFFMPARVPTPEPTITAGSKIPKEVVRDASPAAPVEPKAGFASVRPAAANAAVRRQSTFPAPSEPSDQERALIALMQSRQEILVAMSQSRPREIKGDIDIAPIKLDPLPGGLESSETGRQ
jgi:hypothetical protein